MEIPVGYVNCQLGFTLNNGRDGMTACGFVAEDLSQLTASAVFDNWDNCAYAQDRCVTSTSLVLVRLVVGTSTPGAPIVYEWEGTKPGGNSDPGIQPGTALLLSKKTNLGGRKGRGRCYLPGLSEAAVDAAGNLTGDVSGMVLDAQEFWTDMTTSTSLTDPVLFHEDSTPPSPILDFTCATRVATQRRRLRG